MLFLLVKRVNKITMPIRRIEFSSLLYTGTNFRVASVITRLWYRQSGTDAYIIVDDNDPKVVGRIRWGVSGLAHTHKPVPIPKGTKTIYADSVALAASACLISSST